MKALLSLVVTVTSSLRAALAGAMSVAEAAESTVKRTGAAQLEG